MPAQITVFATAVADVRALIPDIEAIVNPNRPGSPAELMFSDEHLSALLRLNDGHVRLAAADALEALGTTEALILKVIKSEDLSTNGAALMGRYLERARQMRQAHATAVHDAADDDAFELVPYFMTPSHMEPR